jgi:hypothetical protein
MIEVNNTDVINKIKSSSKFLDPVESLLFLKYVFKHMIEDCSSALTMTAPEVILAATMPK